MPQPEPVASPALPVARVAVDTPLSHLDRPFDYAVAAAQDTEAVPGARVRVRFAGRMRDGFVLERLASSDSDRTLAPLARVVSPEPVLRPEVVRLARTVAEHYAGTTWDVLRLAVPPRHAATEQAAQVAVHPALAAASDPDGPFTAYPTGPQLLAALRAGRAPRAAWSVVPTAGPSGDWPYGLACAARATLIGGRSAVLVVPDQRDVDRLRAACAAVVGAQHVAVLTAEAGPAARYRAFLAASRGQARVVVGNRAAAFAPVRDLGLVALYDDGDDLLAEPRAPYPHARTVLSYRAAQAGAGVLFAGYGRTAEVQRFVDAGWLRELRAERAAVRHAAPRVRVAADSDHARARDPGGAGARLPREVFEVIRAALAAGPVLVQVPRAGYRLALVCQDCREPARCPACSGPLAKPGPVEPRPAEPGPADPATTDPATTDPGRAGPTCSWCGRADPDWSCRVCSGTRLRSPVVGAERTAEELGKAFPGTTVRRSSGSRVLAAVPAESAVVVATPGAEPVADGGYAAAVLLDTALLLGRADLRAGEEALRRWLNAVALVRGGDDDGTVIAVGEGTSRALQALVRLDPPGFAARELADRVEARFPPAVALAVVEGDATPLAEFQSLLRGPDGVEVLGPVPLPAERPEHLERQRLLLRAPPGRLRDLARAVKDVLGVRSARKSEGSLRVRIDPAALG